MYPWQLGGGVGVPLVHEELPSIHRTRTHLIAPAARAALSAAGVHARALDLACNEGYFSQLLLEWGSRSVLGVDIRESNVQRAMLVRDHFGIDPARLSFVERDVFTLDAAELGQFDVVLLLGITYHVENPVGLLRLAHSLCRSICIVESQLSRQRSPIEHGWGTTSESTQTDASFAALIEHDAEANHLASAEGRVSLVPNLAALELIIRTAGFVEIETPLRGRPPQSAVSNRRPRRPGRPRLDHGARLDSVVRDALGV